MKTNPKFIHEAMKTYQWPLMVKKPSLRIRLWIKITNPDDNRIEFESDFLNYLSELTFAYPAGLANDIGLKFEKEVSAVEVVDMNGAGNVVYTEW